MLPASYKDVQIDRGVFAKGRAARYLFSLLVSSYRLMIQQLPYLYNKVVI